MNAIEQIQSALGVKKDVLEVVTVIKTGDGFVEVSGHKGNSMKLSGNWQVGAQLVVKNGVVQSVVSNSGVIVYE